MTISDEVTTTRAVRYLAALGRWSRGAIVLGVAGVVAPEVAGGAWPVTFVTPLARQLAALIVLGAVGLIVARGRPTSVGREGRSDVARTGPLKWARPLRVGAVGLIGAYAVLVALGAIPWRDVPTLPRVASGDANLGQLKILSANVHSSNLDRESLLKLIADERPDVIVLMELTSSWIDALRPLGAEYAVREVVADDFGNFGLGVWSRLPGEARLVVRQHLAEPSLLDVTHAEMTLRLNDRPIRVVGLHPLPPLTPAMKGARDALLRSIADEAARDEAPTIVAGDLNATRYCRVTRDVCRRANLADAMAGVGTSWPMTLARPILGIRIDHILAGDAWRVVGSRAGPNVGSDHLPMIATLQLIKETR